MEAEDKEKFMKILKNIRWTRTTLTKEKETLKKTAKKKEKEKEKPEETQTDNLKAVRIKTPTSMQNLFRKKNHHTNNQINYT